MPVVTDLTKESVALFSQPQGHENPRTPTPQHKHTPHLGQVRGPTDPLGHLLSIGVDLGYMLPHPFPGGLVHRQPTPVDEERDASLSQVLCQFFFIIFILLFAFLIELSLEGIIKTGPHFLRVQIL